MNCEDYREAISADPSFEDADHVSQCTDCREFRAEIMALDRKIEQALEIAVPEVSIFELPVRDSSRVVAMPTRRRTSRPAWFAMAASVLVAAVIGVRMFAGGIEYESLADEILAHMDHEPYALRVANRPVSDRRLQSVVPANVATLDHSAGLITYAQTCVINGKKIPHLVIQGRRGPVTVLLLPEEMVSETIPLNGDHIDGYILPVGSGSVAIIGERDETLELIKNSVVDSVTWDI